ncbi:hypothetical protein X975_18165, partial [Stegodyphus mimosarum]
NIRYTRKNVFKLIISLQDMISSVGNRTFLRLMECCIYVRCLSSSVNL